MTWQRATEIVVGRTYSWWDDGTNPWVATIHDKLRPHGPYEPKPAPEVVLAPMLVGELRSNDNGDKPTAVFVDGEFVAVFTAGHEAQAQAYAEHLKGGA